MRHARSHNHDRRTDRAFPAWVAGLALLTALGGGPAALNAASVSARSHAAKSSHQCACGMGCEHACCCAGRKPRPPQPVPRDDPKPSADQPSATPGPCLASAPCDQPGAPTSVPTFAGAKPALAVHALPRHDPKPTNGLLPASSDRTSSTPPEPPEKPPKSSTMV